MAVQMRVPALQNDLLLRALLKQPVARTPVWIMRQAGRYLPEYRATRKRAGDFLALCKTPELACEVALQPVDRFGLDAAILFSDILTIPGAMELGLQFIDGEGPRFSNPVTGMSDVNRIARLEPMNELGYVMDAVRMIKRELNGRVPLIGFAGSPWTLATYMVEGQTSREFRKIKTMLYKTPQVLERLLEVLSSSVAAYLSAQIAAGVQAVMIFDTWGGVLTRDAYLRFSLTPMRQIVERLLQSEADAQTPIILFTKGGGDWLTDIAETGCHAIGLDWTVEIDQARSLVGTKVALQGNLDPNVLYGSDQAIRTEVKNILDKFGAGSGHVFNLGHGIQQHVSPDKVAVLVEAVRELSPAYH